MKDVKTPYSAYPRLPELQWHSPHASCSASGYILSGIHIADLFRNIIIPRISSFIDPICLKYAALITCYLSAAKPTALCRFTHDSSVITTAKLDSINSCRDHDEDTQYFKQHQQIIAKLSLPLGLFSCLSKTVSNGADVHYASSFKPLDVDTSYPLHVNLIGQVSELPGLFVCDPARLHYLSSLPHTFTSMALTEISMPLIINKISS